MGDRAVFNAGHPDDALPAVTAMQKATLYPAFRSALNGSERTVLDFGCGTGRFTPDLAEMTGGTVVGVDPVDSLLERAPHDDRLEYRLMRPARIPVEGSSIDVVWICLVLGGITSERSLRQTTKELQRVLRPDGLLFLAENTTPTQSGRHWTFRSVESYQQLFPSIRLAQLAEYQDRGERISVLSGRSKSNDVS